VALTSDTDELQQLWFRELQGARPGDFFDVATILRLIKGETVLRDLTLEPFPNRPAHGTRQMLFAPLITGDSLIGVLALDTSDNVEEYTDAELGLINAVARLTALVIERDRLQKEREEVRARMLALSQTNQRMDEFLSIASHELKTPITGLVLSTHLMHTYLEQELQSAHQDEPRDIASLQRTRKVLRRAENQLSRLNRLADEILDVSHVRVNQLKLRQHAGDLGQLVEQIVQQVRREHSVRKITLETPGKGPIPVYADLHRVGQVLTNYLTNALKYSDEQESVEVRLSVQGDKAMLTVHDHGDGLTAEERRQVWERFYRSSRISVKSGSEVGLGLGLYVSRAIIEMHGGRVGVRSRVGKGSTFWFTLPLQGNCCDQNTQL
jgi:signal transduction histidine kinase